MDYKLSRSITSSRTRNTTATASPDPGTDAARSFATFDGGEQPAPSRTGHGLRLPQQRLRRRPRQTRHQQRTGETAGRVLLRVACVVYLIPKQLRSFSPQQNQH